MNKRTQCIYLIAVEEYVHLYNVGLAVTDRCVVE